MPTFSPEQKKSIKNCLQEISNSYTRIEAERDNIKDIVDRLADEFELVRKDLIKIYDYWHSIEKKYIDLINYLYKQLIKMYMLNQS
jgi:predicted  nucleic acid-binding Zn-ribbon protein